MGQGQRAGPTDDTILRDVWLTRDLSRRLDRFSAAGDYAMGSHDDRCHQGCDERVQMGIVRPEQGLDTIQGSGITNARQASRFAANLHYGSGKVQRIPTRRLPRLAVYGREA